MKTFHEIVLAEKKKDKKFSIDQINLILLKAGIGPSIITKAMNALNLARGLGLTEGLKLKKAAAGYYSATVGNVEVQLYKADGADYWSSTVVVGDYGSDDWQEESFQAPTKRALVKDIEKFIKGLK